MLFNPKFVTFKKSLIVNLSVGHKMEIDHLLAD
jgi:hypothetical protein